MSNMPADVFSHGRIALTAFVTGVIAAVLSVGVLRGQTRLPLGLSAAIATGLSVYLWRASANLPQLNHDGIAGLSASDWLAPVVVYVTLGLVASVFPRERLARFAQLRAAIVVTAFAVNVITI